MDIYHNHIYLSICEISLDFYKTSNYKNYSEYCKSVYKSILNSNLNRRETNEILLINIMLEMVYSLKQEMIDEMIINYFELPPDKHSDLERVILMFKF